jgi:ADP-ribose pyrophosphatase YjhB (NUDIX family)
MPTELLRIADELRAIATTGLHFTEGEYDRERYDRLLALAARLAACALPVPTEDIESLYRDADRGYVTPKLDVRMAVFRAHHVLLVQERVDDRWALPGGYVEVGDTPSEAAVRETAEEAGVEVRADRLAGVFDYRLQPSAPPHLFHIHKLVFCGRLADLGAEPRAGGETLDARFFALDELPELSLGRTLPIHIECALAATLDPGKPAHFD